jgi:phage N-6-adenine-methyltransferase
MAALRNSGKSKRLGRPRKYKSNADRQRAYRKRLKRSVHFRSDTDLYSTPQALFDALDQEFGFTVDVCALPDNAKCPTYYSPDQDGLQRVWAGVCWCNLPYGTVIAKWVQKAYEASIAGTTVVCLVPARTDTRWWHTYVLPYAEVRFLQGRQRFSESGNSAPFPSAVVIFRPAASVAESEQQLLERLRWGKWTLEELQWLRSHIGSQTTPEVMQELDAKIVAQSAPIQNSG